MHKANRTTRTAHAALIASCIIWGTAFLWGKLALQVLTVFEIVLLRFSLGALALLPAVMVKRAWPEWVDMPRIFLTGFLAVPMTFLLQFHGLALTTSARASLIIGAIPPFLALGGALFLQERPHGREWLAIALSMLGLLVITGPPGSRGNFTGDGLVLLSTVISVVWVLLNKRLSEKYGALVATSYVLLFGTLSLAPGALLLDQGLSLSIAGDVWIPVMALGLLCSALAFVLWNWGLERVPASRAGVYLNLEPLVGALLGVHLLEEPAGPDMMIGGLLIIGAALIMARAPKRERGRHRELGTGLRRGGLIQRGGLLTMHKRTKENINSR